MAEIGSGIGAGFEAGINIARSIEKLEQDKIAAKERSEAHEAQKFSWLSSQLGAALGADPVVRKVQLKRLQAQTGAIGIPWDPANTELLQNDEYARVAQQGILRLNGLPDSQKAQAAASIFAMTGDVGAFGNALSSLGQRYAANAAMAASASQAGKVDAGKALTGFQEARQKIFTEHKDDISALKSAQKAKELLGSPGSSINDQTVLVLFTRLQDPGSVAREGEVQMVKGAAAQSWANSVRQSVQKFMGGGSLSPEDRARIEEAIDLISRPHQRAIAETRAGLEPYLKQAGHAPERVFAGIPTITPKKGKLEEMAKRFAGLSPAEQEKIKAKNPKLHASLSAMSQAAEAPPSMNAGVAAPKGGK